MELDVEPVGWPSVPYRQLARPTRHRRPYGALRTTCSRGPAGAQTPFAGRARSLHPLVFKA